VAIAGHACAWAGVGASNARSNHSRTAGVNEDNGNPARVLRDIWHTVRVSPP
jgi:hypothetical protein